MTASFLILTAALGSGAFAPQVPPPVAAPKASSDLPDDRTPPAAGPLVTVEGCVAVESEIPGRTPNVAERAGVSEDYILTSAKVIKGTAPAAAASDTSGGVISNALRPMYEIGGLSDEQLKVHVGRRVQIEGRFGNVDRSDGDAPLNDDLVELNGATIRMVPGACIAPKKSE